MITEGTIADCSPTEDLRPGIQTRHSLANRGYDRQTILPKANQVEMRPVIRPRKSQRKRENFREITIQIEATGGKESKNCSGI
jgi:hypothetical protein